MYISGTNRAIDTGDTYFNEITKLTVSGSQEAWKRLQRDRIKSLEIYTGQSLEARIEYARFIVDCPNCNNAEYAFEDGLFLCSLCGNSDVQGKVKRVKMPKDRKQIEDILSVRPIKNRHWFPNETVQNLQNENISHGLLGVV